MDPNQLLSQLRDIHAPEAISWWPIAYGWWILALLSIITISACIYLLIKSYRKNAWRRTALKELKLIQLSQKSLDVPTLISKINTLLKRSIASARKDISYLSQIGSEWADTLANPDEDSSNKKILSEREIETFSYAHYLPEGHEFDQRSLKSVEKWIKSLR